jgi:SAM-dependent methyltransferase
MSGNIYDDEYFFSAYREYRKSPHSLNTAIEQPGLKAVLPGLAGTRVLDIGSGLGQFCEYASKQGAAFVLGIDISERMCAEARSLLRHAQNVVIRQGAIEDFDWVGEPFHIIVSSLTLHYLGPDSFEKVIGRLYSWLLDGGAYVMSVNHPIYTATLGGDVAPDDPVPYNMGSYWDEGPRVHTWKIHGAFKRQGVVKYHRTLETYFRVLNDSGLLVRVFKELSPGSVGAVQWIGDPELSERPIFALFKAVKETRR